MQQEEAHCQGLQKQAGDEEEKSTGRIRR